jgi:hypothetical protein
VPYSKTKNEKKMRKELEKNLVKICLELTNKMEECSPNYPFGTCYLVGHCMAEGLKKAGYNSREVTGTSFFKDKNEKNIIYGNSIVKGINVGFYHTWCVLEIDDERVIIDATFKFNKVGIKSYFNLKANNKIPDFIITTNSNSWLYSYVEDIKLISQSKYNLKQVNPNLVNLLIDVVAKNAIEFLSEIKQSA